MTVRTTVDGELYEVLEDRAHFLIEFSEPRHRVDQSLYWANDTAEIIAVDVYRVMAIFRYFHPDTRVHMVRRLGSHKRIIVDREES